MRYRFVLGLAPLLLLPCAAHGAFQDHFDDGDFFGWTIVAFNEATWTASESGTHLTIADVTDPTIDDKAWSWITASHPIALVEGDFVATMRFSYAHEISAMERLRFLLLDAGGNVIVFAGYDDAWLSNGGERWSGIGDAGLVSGQGTLPFAMTDVILQIVRTGAGPDNTQVFWNGSLFQTGTTSAPVASLAIETYFYNYPGSSFGTQSIDVISIVQECPLQVPGDFDWDCDVDQTDVMAFQMCAAGPSLPITRDCRGKDLDHDGDGDLDDFGIMQRCFSGADVPADPSCGTP